jgi:hypothetical protein
VSDESHDNGLARATPAAVLFATLLAMPPATAQRLLQQAQGLTRHRDGGLAVLGVRRVEQISAFPRFASPAERLALDAFR